MEEKKEKKAEIKISGMSCATCAVTVEKSLSSLEGVKLAKVNLGTATTKCPIYKCVNEKNLNSCGECSEFPCELHYNEKTAVYAFVYLNWKKGTLKGTR